jgi:hypothetical protein
MIPCHQKSSMDLDCKFRLFGDVRRISQLLPHRNKRAMQENCAGVCWAMKQAEGSVPSKVAARTNTNQTCHAYKFKDRIGRCGRCSAWHSRSRYAAAARVRYIPRLSRRAIFVVPFSCSRTSSPSSIALQPRWPRYAVPSFLGSESGSTSRIIVESA